jgi:hypothetical protein
MEGDDAAKTTIAAADDSWKLWRSNGEIQVWGHDSMIYNKYATKAPKYNDIKLITTDLRVAERAAGKKYVEDEKAEFVNHDGAYLSCDEVVKISLNHLSGLNPRILKKFLKDNLHLLGPDCTKEKIDAASRYELVKIAWVAPKLQWGRIDKNPEEAAEQESRTWWMMDMIEKENEEKAARGASKVSGQKRKAGSAN